METKARGRRLLPLDGLWAFLVALVGIISFSLSYGTLTVNERVMFFLITVGYTLPTVIRRLHPNVSATVLIVVGVLRYFAFPSEFLPIDIALLLTIYAVVVYGISAMAVATISTALAGGIFIMVPLMISTPTRENLLGMLLLILLVFAVAAFALARRALRLQKEQFLREQEQRSRQIAAHEHAASIRERSHIARDMHDIVAHTLAVIVAQADGGRYAGRKDPDKAIETLERIAEMTRAALGDIRQIVSVLREPDDLDAPLTPQPVAQNLTELIEQVRLAGYPISFAEVGQRLPLPAGTGNALYRICQEALTNSMKHGGEHVSIAVTLEWRARTVILSIVDDGRGASAPDDGHGNGIIGMTERATAFGGTLEAGPRSGGGFRVNVVIPVRGAGERSAQL
ncbi:MAG: sensor histidine kinase [Actinomycetaceae bacterium]|nr:sensor histidine kinase [Actinomycetaceae bacterium]